MLLTEAVVLVNSPDPLGGDVCGGVDNQTQGQQAHNRQPHDAVTIKSAYKEPAYKQLPVIRNWLIILMMLQQYR